jgi:hypothetical protein
MLFIVAEDDGIRRNILVKDGRSKSIYRQSISMRWSMTWYIRLGNLSERFVLLTFPLCQTSLVAQRVRNRCRSAIFQGGGRFNAGLSNGEWAQ